MPEEYCNVLTLVFFLIKMVFLVILSEALVLLVRFLH